MKVLRPILLGLVLVVPSTVIAGTHNATVDEETFWWENALSLSMADPCASYLTPVYYSGGHEGHYDDDGNDLRY